MKYTKAFAFTLAFAVLTASGSGVVLANENSGYGSLRTGVSATTSVKTKTDSGLHLGLFKNNVMGTVTAVNGTTLVVMGENGTTYSVDASSTQVVGKTGSTSLSSVRVGDKVLVKGTVSSTTAATTTVSARLIFDDIGKFFKRIGHGISKMFKKDKDHKDGKNNG